MDDRSIRKLKFLTNTDEAANIHYTEFNSAISECLKIENDYLDGIIPDELKAKEKLQYAKYMLENIKNDIAALDSYYYEIYYECSDLVDIENTVFKNIFVSECDIPRSIKKSTSKDISLKIINLGTSGLSNEDIIKRLRFFWAFFVLQANEKIFGGIISNINVSAH